MRHIGSACTDPAKGICCNHHSRIFPDKGMKVMLMMDSVTRFAMAKRGRPCYRRAPATKGYTPQSLPSFQSCWSAQASDKGSITAFYTVLVDGDDMNEPIADAVRESWTAILCCQESWQTATILGHRCAAEHQSSGQGNHHPGAGYAGRRVSKCTGNL